jgi:hypothetical protein
MMGRLQKWKGGPAGTDVPAASPQGDKKKLAEVKAVLERLHRISAQPEDPAPNLAENAGSGIAALSRKAAAIREEAGGRAKPGPVSGRQPHLLAGAAGALLLVGLGSGAVWWMRGMPHPSDRALNLTLGKDNNLPPGKESRTTAALPGIPSVTKPIASETSELAEAEKMMDGGKILAARRILIGDLATSSPDAALMLARSYDPNFLRTITGADAGPDIAEAERWYRTWHANAAAKGLLMEPERLDRIIRAMR